MQFNIENIKNHTQKCPTVLHAISKIKNKTTNTVQSNGKSRTLSVEALSLPFVEQTIVPDCEMLKRKLPMQKYAKGNSSCKTN